MHTLIARAPASTGRRPRWPSFTQRTLDLVHSAQLARGALRGSLVLWRGRRVRLLRSLVLRGRLCILLLRRILLWIGLLLVLLVLLLLWVILSRHRLLLLLLIN